MNYTHATKPVRPPQRTGGDALPYPQVVPTLRISNPRLSRAFYTALFGFRIDWERSYDPEMAVCMQISRDGMVLFLTEHAGDCPPGALVHCFVPDVDALYAELRAKGTPVKEAPHIGLDGHRAMTLLDPDGNQFRICSPLTA